MESLYKIIPHDDSAMLSVVCQQQFQSSQWHMAKHVLNPDLRSLRATANSVVGKNEFFVLAIFFYNVTFIFRWLATAR